MTLNELDSRLSCAPESLDRASVSLRQMESGDLTEVLVLERLAQETPWSRLSFEESLSRGHRCCVAVVDNRVVAFSIVCLIVDELHILNLVTAQHWRGRGLGHVLMQDLLDYAGASPAVRILLEVRASNQVARSLYQKWQFRQIALRQDYYRTATKQREDAIVLVRALDHSCLDVLNA